MKWNSYVQVPLVNYLLLFFMARTSCRWFCLLFVCLFAGLFMIVFILLACITSMRKSCCLQWVWKMEHKPCNKHTICSNSEHLSKYIALHMHTYAEKEIAREREREIHATITTKPIWVEAIANFGLKCHPCALFYVCTSADMHM